MHTHEAAAVTAVAAAGGESARPLALAVAADPHHVRVVHMGHEVLGAFLLADLPGHVEEVSCITLNDEGKRAGAEPLLLDYVVKAARFSRKRAVEVVTWKGSAEEAHLSALGFQRAEDGGEAGLRYRLKLRGK
jgi:hypothetical protein